jgi:hypothetical protein
VARLAWLYLAVVPACIDIPPFPMQSVDAGSDPLPRLTATIDDGTGRTLIETAIYRLRFENEGWRMPESLELVRDVSEAEWLAYNAPYNEDGLGVSLYPEYFVNADPDQVVGSGTRTVPVAGPVKAVVEVTWEGPALCGGATPVTGTSRFTFFPDGRIVRVERVNSGETCADRYVGPNLTLATGQLEDAAWDREGVPGSTTYPSDMVVPLSNQPRTGWLCLHGGLFTLGMTWRPPPQPEPWSHVEFALNVPATRMSYYFSEEVPLVADHAYAAHMALFIRDDAVGCIDFGAFAATYQEAPVLMGATFRADDGVYVVPGPGTYTADAELARGFVVEVPGTAVSVARMSPLPERAGALRPGVDYAIQTDAASTLWFADALRAGEALVF